MFDYSNMIKRAIEFFPIWSDIRKRGTKSIGGMVVNSALEETLELEKAIQAYKDFYFLDKYQDKEEEVIAYVYAANVGTLEDLDNTSIIYNDQEYFITLDIDEFYSNETLAYYENGLIYIQEALYNKNNINSIILSIDDYKYTYTLERKHVWNIFDEFACFVGLERHTNESNTSLKERILFSTKNLGSNTEEGLKNAIMSELIGMFPEMQSEEIEITKLTPESLTKPYKEFNSLLDMLSSINRDVLKDKRWDLDKWSYDFKSIAFLDNVWDDVIETYQNGIGHGDDLKVVIADNDTTTDADIVLYNKSIVKLDKYVADKHIKKNINFKLKRYENILNPIKAKYAIKASEAIDITHENIELSVFENNEKKESRKIEEIYKIGKGVTSVDNSKITDDKPYRLEFYSDSNFDGMKISKAKVIYKHKTTGEIIESRNLLKAAPGFSYNASGELVNTSIKKTVKSVNHFNQYENLADSKSGIVLASNRNEGKAVLNVSGLGLNLVNIDIENQLADIPKSLIKYNQFCFWREDELVFRYDTNKERKFEIETEANIISFKLLEGDADVFIEIDGVTEYFKISGNRNVEIFSESSKLSPKKMKVTVISNSVITTKFSDFKYCCHTVDLKLQYGALIKDSEGYRLPNFAVNSLIVSMSSKTSSSPVLKSIYIGADIRQLRYKTEVIESRPNTNRIIEIKSNCLADLLHVDVVGNTVSKTENYVPATSYKAVQDDAWIRLNTDEYESIKEITTSVGAIHVIEESGKLYYNISLKMGQTVNSVIIDGVKNVPAKTITLEKMIQSYIPHFDKETDRIYACKLCKGLLVADNDPDNPKLTIVNIKSNIFTGINASYYKFTKLPNTLGIVFNNDTSEIHSSETNLPFNSISFMPGGTKVYQAINEANIYTGEVRGIKILNNFSPILNSSALMYYQVEPFESNVKYEVKFSSTIESDNSFDDLLNWSVGLKDIAIKTPIDLSNTENYEISELEVTDEVLLSRHIELQKSYKIGDNREVFTNRYMIIPESGTVLYERYSDNQNQSLIVQEEIIMEEDGFTKLAYSNIDEMLYTGFSPYSGSNELLVKDFELLKDEGIILWTNKDYINASRKVYLRYTIKNPIAILLDEDLLYKAIGYNVDAYDEVGRFKIAGVDDGYRFDLRQIDNYQDVDMVYTICSSPAFQADGFNDILTFKKTVNRDTILVRTGYYYINGREYYLFPSKDEIVLDEEKYIDMENVELSGEEITLFKRTDNYVRNSEMLFRGMNELYNFDASKSQVKGVSAINSITACDSFNSWNVFGTKMVLKDGLNQLGISFMPEIPNGYAYIELTDYLEKGDNYLSFWAEKSLEVFIGEEKKYLGLNFPDSISIKIGQEIPYRDDEIRTITIKQDDNKKYYLIVKGQGTIDDIILSNDISSISAHTKNIDLLGLSINEGFKQGQKHRVFLNSNKDAINKGAALTKDGYVKTASNMYWGISPLKSYDSKEDFATCSTENIHFENSYVRTGRTEGYIETAPIYLDNPMTIKRVIVKANEIGFDDMRGFKIQILSSNTREGVYMPINTFNDNYGYVYGDALLKYIKIKVTMPDNKFLNNLNIYAEYKSTEANAPKVLMPSSGELITKIYDAQYSTDYRIREISIADISNINDVEIQVRASKEDYSADVWHPWQTLELKHNLTLKNELKFYGTRFFQIKVLLKTSNAFIKINNIDIEVM
mgnify:FL=1